MEQTSQLDLSVGLLVAAAVALPRMADDWFWKRWMLLKRTQIK